MYRSIFEGSPGLAVNAMCEEKKLERRRAKRMVGLRLRTGAMIAAAAALFIVVAQSAEAASAPGPPESFKVIPKQWTKKDKFKVSWKNPKGTIIVGAYYKVDKKPVSPTDGKYVSLKPGKTVGSIGGIKVHSPGDHPIYVWLKDSGGKASEKNRAEGHLLFDNTPPPAPIDLTVTPEGWVIDDMFTVSWTNPSTSDRAPVTGVYYKLDAMPDASDDGAYVPLTAGDVSVALFGITVQEPGDHPIYVWLKDEAGNVSKANISEGHLLYAPNPAPDPSGGGGNQPGPQPSPASETAVDDTSPVIALGLSHKYFRIGRARGANKWKRGTEINFTLSRDANVTFTVVRNIPGRKLGHKCLRVRRRQRSKRYRCAIFKTVGSFTRKGHAGTNSVRFNGWLNGRRLKPGLYHVYVRVGSGNSKAAPQLFSWRVVHNG